MTDINELRPPIAEKCMVFCKDRGYYIGFRANGGWYLWVGDTKIYVPNDEKDKKYEITKWELL
jgi:hypothetical protein